LVWEAENPRKGYRSKLRIVRDILSVAERTGKTGSRKTHIMYGANLSHQLLVKYLKLAIKSGLINEKESRYFITNKGSQYLKTFEKYDEQIDEIKNALNHLNNQREELKKLYKS